MSDPTALPNFMAPGTTTLRDRVHETLNTMGAEPSIDDDGDIKVTVNEQLLFIRTMDGELPFMRIFGQWQIGDQIKADETEQLRLASEMTTRLNLVKMSLHQPQEPATDGNQDGALLLAAADVIVSDDMMLDRVLANCIMGILNSVTTWHAAAGGMSLDDALAQQQEAALEAARQAAEQSDQPAN